MSLAAALRVFGASICTVLELNQLGQSHLPFSSKGACKG